MALLEALEQKALFRLTRLLALIVIFAIALGLVGVVIFTTSTAPEIPSVRVPADAVVDALRPPSSTSNPSQGQAESADSSVPPTYSDLPGIKIPFALQPYIAIKDFRGVIARKLNDLPSEDRQEYLDNMAEVVTKAQNSKLDLAEAIDTYIKLKEERISDIREQKAARTQRFIYIAQSVAAGMGLIGLFSLILVLLAIERNTRLVGTP